MPDCLKFWKLCNRRQRQLHAVLVRNFAARMVAVGNFKVYV